MGKANLPFTVKSQLIAHTQIKAQLKLWPTLNNFEKFRPILELYGP